MNSLPKGVTILAENGVGKCALYNEYGERIPFWNFYAMMREWRIAEFARLTGIKLK